MNVYATSGIYLTFTVKTQSNNLIYEGNNYTVLQEILFKIISFMHFEQGMSFRKISAFLNKSGIKTIRGCSWSVTGSSAHSVLKRKEYETRDYQTEKKSLIMKLLIWISRHSKI